MSNREQRAQERRILLGRWQKSGLSLKAFAAQEGVAYTTLAYWKRREDLAGSDRETQSSDLVPVQIRTRPRVAGGAPFELRLANGVEIRVLPGFDREELSRLVEAVSAC